MDEQQPEQSVKKPKGGRPLGSKNKIGDRTPKPNWLSDLVSQCYPREEYERRFKSLPPEKQFEIATKLAPRSLSVDTSPQIRLIIGGLEQKSPIDRPGKIV